MGIDLQSLQIAGCSTRSTLPACLWCLLSHHLQSIQHLPLLKVTILILDRPTWGATVSTRTPTAIWSRRWCLRISASPTQRRLATHRTRSHVPPSRSETALVSLKLMSRESVSTLTSWCVTLSRQFITRLWRRLTRCRGALLGRTGSVILHTRSI